jgi:hypothetical protein
VTTLPTKLSCSARRRKLAFFQVVSHFEFASRVLQGPRFAGAGAQSQPSPPDDGAVNSGG